MGKMRDTTISCLKLFGLIGQHLAAPMVSFVFSIASACAIMFFDGFFHLGPRAFTAGCAVIGFCGAVMGARCLPASTRRIGSIGLLLLGLFFFYRCIASFGSDFNDEGKVVDMSSTALEELILLALGGLTAVVVIWWMSYLDREFPNRKHGTHQAR